MDNDRSIRRLRVIDSHTAGEPTRVIVDGAPELAGVTMVEKRESLRNEHDWLRTASILEPRGHEAVVGALLCESAREDCFAGVIFFNNVGCIHGCIHGTIGVAETLAHLGRIEEETFGLETPVGRMEVRRGPDGRVTVRNVRSYRSASDVALQVEGYGEVRGEIAWGGNWFYLIDDHPGIEIHARNIEALTRFTWAVRQALAERGITGENGGEIDHIEVFGPPADPHAAESKNFVLCPGKAYDRSPCGTGTSAKLACLHADGRIQPGQTWRQAGILDTAFEGSVEIAPEGGVIPSISGRAFITAEAGLILQPGDPFRDGITV